MINFLNFENFPKEIAYQIFSSLPIVDQLRCAQVNKSWYQIITDSELWRINYKKLFLHNKSNPLNSEINFLDAFRYAYQKDSEKLLDKTLRQLFNCVKEGQSVTNLIPQTTNLRYLDIQDGQGYTLLDWAFHKKNQNAMDSFFKHIKLVWTDGAKIDYTKIDLAGRSLIHWAVLCHQIAFLKNLPQQTIPLIYAIDKKQKTPVHWALDNDDLPLAADLLNYPKIKNQFEKLPLPLLHYAAKLNKPNTIKFLLTQGFTVNDIDLEGNTALHYACLNGRVNTAIALLEEGCFPEAKNKRGLTALHHAASQGQASLLSILLDKKPQLDFINARDIAQQTALHKAVAQSNVESVIFLLEHQAQVTLQDSNQQTPLHIAAEKGHLEALKELLAITDKIDITDNKLETPLHKAAANGHEKTVSYLLSQGASIKAVNRQGWTPLHFAAFRGHDAVINTLLSYNAPLIVEPTENENPLQLAINNGWDSTIALLNCEIFLRKGEEALKKYQAKSFNLFQSIQFKFSKPNYEAYFESAKNYDTKHFIQYAQSIIEKKRTSFNYYQYQLFVNLPFLKNQDSEPNLQLII